MVTDAIYDIHYFFIVVQRKWKNRKKQGLRPWKVSIWCLHCSIFQCSFGLKRAMN